MRTTLTIDDAQVNNLMQATGQKSAISAIRQALADYLLQSRKRQVLALRGQVVIDDNWQALRALDTAGVVAGASATGRA